MSEYDSIHMFDINLIIDYFSETKRQGPGSPEMTLKALSFVDNLSANAPLLDKLGLMTKLDFGNISGAGSFV